MSYQINKTTGELLTELVDGQIDTSSTDLTLVGKNYKGYGEAFNENFVALLENFASSSAPGNPLKGQVWYDTGDNRLKIYNGTEFRVAGGPIVSPNTPANLVEGDLWIDNNNNKLYMWDGTDLTLVGPTYTSGQGKTIFEAKTLIDTANTSKTVLALYIGGVLAGILSRQAFTPSTASTLPPYAAGREIKVGFNPVDVTNFKFQGTASKSESLVDSLGTAYTSNDFVRTSERDSSNNVVDQTMLGSLFVKGNTGIKIGIGDTQYGQFYVPQTETTTVLESIQNNQDLAIRVTKGSDSVDAVKIDTSTSRVGIFNSAPTASLDVTGDGKFSGSVTIAGDLTVNGGTTNLQVSVLQSQDKNLELGYLQNDDSTLSEGNNASVDNAGIIVVSSDGSKDITWKNATGSWTSNQNFDLIDGREYRIGDDLVLSKTRLGDTIDTAAGLTNIGTLTSLNVSGNITLGANLINSGPMSITTGGTITFANVRLTGLDTPVATNDASTKAYVDNEIATIPTSFSLDITGLTTPNPPGTIDGPITDVKNILDDISPVTTVNNGAYAKIHCVSYNASTITGIPVTVSTDGTGTLQKTFIAVDSAGTQNVSAVQDIAAANTTSGTFTPSPTRYTMTFIVAAGTWTHQATENYA